MDRIRKCSRRAGSRFGTGFKKNTGEGDIYMYQNLFYGSAARREQGAHVQCRERKPEKNVP